jgi:hypothetical protein
MDERVHNRAEHELLPPGTERLSDDNPGDIMFPGILDRGIGNIKPEYRSGCGTEFFGELECPPDLLFRRF